VHQKFDEQGLLLDAAFEPKIKVFLDRFLWLAEAVAEKKETSIVKMP
jgi:hypothetical protein